MTKLVTDGKNLMFFARLAKVEYPIVKGNKLLTVGASPCELHQTPRDIREA